MRIDIKKVMNSAYIQLVNKQGHIFHVGPATNYDSWLIALMIWEKEWRKEYIRKREEVFNKIENQIRKYISMDYFDLESLNTLRLRDRYDFRIARKSLRVPQTMQFGDLIKTEPPENQHYPYRWKWNERGKQLKKRLRAIYFKQRRIKLKEEKLLLKPKKEIEFRRITPIKVMNSRKKILLLLEEIEKKKGIAELSDILNESAIKLKMTEEYTKKIIHELLRNGEIFQVKNNCYKKT